MALSWVRKGLWAVLVLVIGGGAAYAVLVGKPKPEPEVPPVFAPPTVDVVVVTPATHALSVDTQGTVRPLREIKLVAQVGGRVESVSSAFARGGFFATDDELVKIEGIDYELAIARAESQVAASRQQLAEEEGRSLQARREWRDLGSDKANALFLRKPQIASAESALRASQADLTGAELDLARTSIRGPFNGRVVAKEVDMGQFVSPGTVIAEVYDTDVALVRLPLTGRQVALLDLPLTYENAPVRSGTVAAAVELRARFAAQEWRWQGRIVRTGASIDENSRVVFAVAEVDKPFERVAGSERPPLSPGMFVHATITGRPISALAELPRTALRSDDTVVLVDAQSKTRIQAVRVLQSNGKTVWVQGLKAGDRVVSVAGLLFTDGVEVTANSTANGAASASSGAPE